MGNLKNVIYEDLKSHIFIEYFYGTDKAFISEQLIKCREKLFESYGLFNGCNEIAQKVYDTIKSFPKSNVLYVPVGHKFVDVIKLTIIYIGYDGAMYEPNKCEVDENGHFKVLSISIDSDLIKSHKKLFGSIMHELMHAYQDYNLIQKGYSLKSQMMNYGYYSNNIGQYENDNIKDMISWLLYYLNGYERSAYVSDIRGQLEACKKVFNNISEIVDYIKNTDTYFNYEVIFQYSEQILGVTNADIKKDILKYANGLTAKKDPNNGKIYGLNNRFPDFKAFARWLKGRLDSVKRKFETIIPKIAYEHLKINEILSPQINGRLVPKNI